MFFPNELFIQMYSINVALKILLYRLYIFKTHQLIVMNLISQSILLLFPDWMSLQKIFPERVNSGKKNRIKKKLLKLYLNE